MTRKRLHLTPEQVDRLVRGTPIGTRLGGGASLAAAKDYFSGRCATVQQAADRYRITRQSASRVVGSIRALAEREAKRAGCIHVGVMVPPSAVPDLEAWVDDRGGEVVR